MEVTDLSETPATNYQKTRHHRLITESRGQDVSWRDGSRKKVKIFLNVTPCGLVYICRSYREFRCLRFQDRWPQMYRNLLHWSWRQYVSPKRRHIYTRLHNIIPKIWRSLHSPGVDGYIPWECVAGTQYIVKDKVHPITGHEGAEGSRGIDLLFL